MVTVAILVLALIMSLATAVAAFADSSGQGGFPGGGQFQNRMQNEFIQALATASNQTAAQIQQDMTNGQTVAQIAQQLAQAGTITETHWLPPSSKNWPPKIRQGPPIWHRR